ncbi:MAG: iron ABC transporter permease [Rothia sp. (in: high G+C Gram-positive bacteria)]|nr:iron ABC transporter permease [Rothia sp. (in: high G+C Gram-positive bacteria)]
MSLIASTGSLSHPQEPATIPPNPDKTHQLGLQGRRRVASFWLLTLTIATLAAATLGLLVGSVPLNLGQALTVIGHHTLGLALPENLGPATDAIIWQVRLPRIILALAVGTLLALSGMVLQAMVRNPLAEPHLLGINSGASAGAALAILFGLGAGALGSQALPITAFLGALIASAMVYLLATTGGRFTSHRLLLSGVAVGYALTALTSFLIVMSGNAEGTRSVMFWLLGSLALASWGISLTVVVAVTVLTGLIFYLMSHYLDVLSVGDESAHTMGLSPEKIRIVLLLVVSLGVGTAVAASGSIGFIGLIVPHLTRKLVGATHRLALPVAAVMGAGIMTLADILSRTLIAPQELPIGILTALLGTPLLIMLIRAQRA